MVERFGILRRPLCGTIEHVTKAVSACIHLHNMAIEDDLPQSKPLTCDIRLGDSMAPLRQDKVTVAERGIKKHLVTCRRQQITDDLREAGRVRLGYKRQRD